MDIVGICRFSLVGRGDWKAYRGKSDAEVAAIAMQQAEHLFTPERMEARLKSFEHLTLASLRAQTDQDFRFLVLASEMMPQHYRDRLEDICARIPQVVLRFFGLSSVGEAQMRVYRELRLKLADTIQFRLDDDDCLCADYIEQLKAHAQPMLDSPEPFAISLGGVLYCATVGNTPATYHWPVRFLAVGLALKHDTKSIFGFGHFALEQRFRSCIIPDRLALVSHSGINDTTFTPEMAKRRGFVLLDEGQIAERLAQNFPFLTARAKVLVGLPRALQTDVPMAQSHPHHPPVPFWLHAMATSRYRRGFFIAEDSFALQHTRRKRDVLYVGFDDLSRARDKNRLRDPWGYGLAEQRRWSSLGVMAFRPDWFRSPDLFAHLLRLRDGGFFEGYRKVVFSGVSMGAYAACAFSSLAPGSTVIAFSPQSTLDPKLAEWDRRYPSGSRADWSGPFADGAVGLRDTRKAWIVYDPEVAEDRRHAERLAGRNVELLRARHAAHFTAQFLGQIGVLSRFVDECVEGGMTPARFYQLYRQARSFRRFLGGVTKKAVARDDPWLASRLQVALAAMNRPAMAAELRRHLAGRADGAAQPKTAVG